MQLGVDVTLFTTADSQTHARLVPIWDQASRSTPADTDTTALHFAAFEETLGQAKDYQWVHFHLDWIDFPAVRRNRMANVTALHNRIDRIDRDDLQPRLKEHHVVPLLSLSGTQRDFAPDLNGMGTVDHGLRLDRDGFQGNSSNW